PFDPDRTPRAARIRIQVVSHPDLRIEIPKIRDRMIVQGLGVAVVRPTVFHESLRLEPELVLVGADPSFAFPSELVLRAVGASFELAKEEVRDYLIVHHRRLPSDRRGVRRVLPRRLRPRRRLP